MNLFFVKIIEYRAWILGSTLAVMAYALWSLPSLPIDAVPDISSQQVVVNTKTGALTPPQIEKVVTYPIEMELSGVPQVKEIRSLSKFGLSQVVVVFHEPIDLYFARQQISERLMNIYSQLPDGVRPEISPMTTGLGEILMWTLSLKEDSPLKGEDEKTQLQYLRWIQETRVRPLIKQVPGVAEVDTNGGFNSELHINFDPKTLFEQGLNTFDVIDAVESLGMTFSGGYIKRAGEQISVAAETTSDDIESVRNHIIKIFPDGRALRLKDVCRVEIDSSLRNGAATAQGQETVLGTVLMRTGENSRAVANASSEQLKKIILPEDVHLEVVYNRQNLVMATIQTVAKNLGEGAALVIIILFILLGHFRAAAIVAMAIPLSMLVAFKMMGTFKISANLMSLGAIDFGLLVDASVVIVENYLRRLSLVKGPMSPSLKVKTLVDSCREVAKPVIFGLTIIMLVYVPILWLEGVEGKMFSPMAQTILLALAASLVVALVVMPVLLYFVIPTSGDMHSQSRLLQFLAHSYYKSLRWVLKKPVLVLSVSFLLLIMSLSLASQLGRDFVPELNEGDMIIGLIRDPKQNIEESVSVQKKVEKIIQQYPEVDNVFSRIGTPESATDPMGPSFADTFLILKKDFNDWPDEVGRAPYAKEELFEKIKEQLESHLPEQDISMTQPVEMRLNEVLEGSRADVSLRIIGPSLEVLMNLAEKAQKVIEPIQGIQSIEFDALTGLKKSTLLSLKIDSKKAQIYGLNSGEIAAQLEVALAGKTVGQFFKEDRRIPIVFHLDESLRDKLKVLKKLPISLPNGGSISLDKVANLNENERVTTIARRYSERYSALSMYLKDRDLHSFVQEAQAQIKNQIQIPQGYRLEWGGQFENLARAQKKLALLVPILALVIFLLILKVTGTWQQTLLIFLAVPFGLAGGLLLLYGRDIRLSVSAMVGFIALSGIVILNSVVLVTFINDLFAKGLTAREAIAQGVEARFRPILMTASVASLGFLPMAFGSGAGAEVQRPLATVVIGGLLTSTLLTLYVLPLLMTLWPQSLRKPHQEIEI